MSIILYVYYIHNVCQPYYTLCEPYVYCMLRQTVEWQIEKGQQRSSKHYTENTKSSSTNPAKTRGELGYSRRVG